MGMVPEKTIEQYAEEKVAEKAEKVKESMGVPKEVLDKEQSVEVPPAADVSPAMSADAVGTPATNESEVK